MLTRHSSGGHTVWVDLLNPSDAEIAETQQKYQVSVPSRDALSEIESSSRLNKRDRQLYLSMPLLPPADGNGGAPPLGFIVTPDIFVTIRFSELPAIQQLMGRCDTAPGIADSAHVFLNLLEIIVDRAADLLEHQTSRLAQTSSRTFRKRSPQQQYNHASMRMFQRTLLQVGRAGEHLSDIRDTLLGLQRITPYVAESAADWLPQDVIAGLRIVQRDVTSLVDFESHLSNKVQFLLDATLGFISTQQNEIFKVLTIASVIGIPPTFIASMYGMNFRNMPELSWSWGYEYGLALIAISTVIPIVWFKIRGWW